MGICEPLGWRARPNGSVVAQTMTDRRKEDLWYVRRRDHHLSAVARTSSEMRRSVLSPMEHDL
jgi:hypothetical protein